MKTGMRPGNPTGQVTPAALYVTIPAERAWDRRLSWTPTHASDVVHHIVVDGQQHAVTDQTEYDGVPQDARAAIEVIETSVQNAGEDLSNVATQPMDRARVTWDEVTGDPYDYLIERRTQGGDYPDDPIAGPLAGDESYQVDDGPLADGTYEWRGTARDAAGNAAVSGDTAATVSSTPEPPTGLAASVAANTLTITWTASTSADVDHYAIYRSGADGLVQVPADAYDATAPLDTVAASPYTEDVSALSGRYCWLVRAVDSDGNEEAGLRAMVAVNLTTGTQDLRPNVPEVMDARAVVAGQVKVLALYSRTGESGVATTLWLYANDGAGGAVDYNTPVGSATLKTGLSYQAVEITTSGLTGGLTYLIAARARTAAGLEDAGTDTSSVTTDSTAPGTPSLTVTIH